MKIDSNTVVVVTGGSAGVGRAAARQFARAGARVAVLARDPARLEATRLELEHEGARALAIPADVADRARVEAAAQQVEEELGPIELEEQHHYVSSKSMGWVVADRACKIRKRLGEPEPPRWHVTLKKGNPDATDHPMDGP